MNRVEEMIDFANEQLEIFGKGSQMHELLEQFLKMAHSLRMIEFNAYCISEEMKHLRGEENEQS